MVSSKIYNCINQEWGKMFRFRIILLGIKDLKKKVITIRNTNEY